MNDFQNRMVQKKLTEKYDLSRIWFKVQFVMIKAIWKTNYQLLSLLY